MKYTFYSRDYFSNRGDFQISHQHYNDIINFCYTYGDSFSLVSKNKITSKNDMFEEWRISLPEHSVQNKRVYKSRRFYKCCEENRILLLQLADNILNRFEVELEDLAFYRKDKSLLFSSITHEGEYSVFPLEDENVQSILRHGHWLEMVGGSPYEEGLPHAPASEHVLFPQTRWNLLEEPLYEELIAFQRASPCKDTRDIRSILHLIDNFCKNGPEWTRDYNLPSAISFTPPWYSAFRLYILGALGAYTDEDVGDVIVKAGYTGSKGIQFFFACLDKFVNEFAEIDLSGKI